MICREHITGGILAGGRGRRMTGADKGLLLLNGRPLITHVIDIIQPHVNHLIISANRHPDRYRSLGYPVIADAAYDFQGPLAGSARILEQADTPYVMIVPCDTPFLPENLVQRLAEELYISGSDAAVARSADGVQPLCVLLSRQVAPNLRDYMASGGRKAVEWMSQLNQVVANFPEQPHAFYNINTPMELSAAEAMLMGM